MKEILNFLRDLEKNNNRVWFNTNKERYQKVLKKWNAFCESLITEIGRFDADIAPLTIKDCTYRIYRDTRFKQGQVTIQNSFRSVHGRGVRSQCMQDIISISEQAMAKKIHMPTCLPQANIAKTIRLSRYCVKILATNGKHSAPAY